MLSDHLTQSQIRELALPSNYKYGSAIFGRHAVKFITQSGDAVEAWVGGLDGSVIEGGGSRRRVNLWLEGGELAWHCTGNPKDHQIFCKHCVALALALAI